VRGAATRASRRVERQHVRTLVAAIFLTYARFAKERIGAAYRGLRRRVARSMA